MIISNKLQKWVEQGLISQKQADEILLSEQSSNSNIIWRWMYGIAGLFIGLGFILLISANWDNISAPFKLLGNFTIWSGILYGTYWSIIHKKNKIKELFLILSFLCVGATIGLIAQIFNLSGGWHSYAMSWSLLGLPFVLFSQLLSFNFCWWCLFFSMFNSGMFEKIFSLAEKNPICLTLVVLCLSLLSFVGKKLNQLLNKYTLLAKAFQHLSMFIAYILIFLGSFDFFSRANLFIVYVFSFLFFAIRMFLAVKTQNMHSFKRNAIIVECYLFLIFANRYGNLLTSGFGFILGGIIILAFIYLLRRTSKYIKTMEVFHE